MPRSKNETTLEHAQRRFRQRYGEDIELEQMKALVHLAQKRKCAGDCRAQGGARYAKFRFRDKVIKMIWHPHTGHILTFLP